MYTARFLCNIYEEKYAIIPYNSWGFDTNKWYLGDEHLGVSYSLGYKMNNVMRYEKVKEQNVIFHEEEIGIEFEKGNKVKIGKEHIIIIDVIRNLDGSIDYLTDKIKYIPLNTKETYFDERPEQKEETEEELEKPTPLEVRTIYENFTGTEKEYNFWKRLLNVFKSSK